MVNALNELHDIHVPPPISWWPLAPGYFLLIMIIVLTSIGIGLHYRYRRARQIKKASLRELTNYQNTYNQHPEQAAVIAAQISLLLKQVALLYYPRDVVASLQGDAWLRFLTESGKKLDFTRERAALLEAPFVPTTTVTLTGLFSLARHWIKQRSHRCLN
jgi:hypothetical protein